MANDIKWLKLMNTMFEDDKIEYIESLPDGDTVLVIWIKVLCLASKCNDNGNLMVTSEIPYTPALLASKFKKSVTQVNYALALMQKLGMIDIIEDIINVSNWCKYQSVDELAKIREQNRLRVAKHREKKALLEGKKEEDNDCNVTSNVTVTQNCNDFALISNSSSISNSDIVSLEEINHYFDKTYKLYPRKVCKEQARKTYEHKLRGLDKEEAHKKAGRIYKYLEQIIAGWERENDGQGRKVEYMPYFSSWLNNEIDDSPHFNRGKK